VVVNDAQRLAELRYCWRMIDREERSEETTVDFGVEDGHANPILGEQVGVGARLPSD